MSSPSSELWKWEFVPQPRADELFSSWLARTAAAHGLSLHRFAVDYLRIQALNYRDMDVFPTRRLIGAVIAGTGLAESAVLSMTLVPYLEHLSSGAGTPGHFDAVLPRAQVARAKFHYGQQACVRCLAEGAPYRRSWRLPFVVACERHDEWLIDSCPNCDAPLDPRPCASPQPACGSCYQVWVGRPVEDRPFFSAVAEVQRWLLQALEESGCVEIDGRSVPLVDALRGFGYLLRLDRKLKRAEALPIERAPSRIAGRIRRLERLASLLDTWPHGIVRDALRMRIPQDPFGGESCPAWVLRGLVDLREVKPRGPREATEEDPVLATLRRRRAANWRSRYAHRLMRLAGKTRGA